MNCDENAVPAVEQAASASTDLANTLAECRRPRSADPVEGRDLRIDWLRGLSLLLMYIDHVPQNVLASFTLQRFQFIDTAEVFVFISGYVCGMVYTSTYLSKGLAGCFRKALRRCRQLYVAQLAMFVCSCVVLYQFAIRSVFVINRDSNVYAFMVHPFRTILSAAMMMHAPGLTGLLPLYGVLLCITPGAIYAIRRRPVILVLSSLFIYAAVQAAPYLNFYFLYPQRRAWEFNPAAWQLVFVGGLLLGSHQVRPLRLPSSFPKWLAAAAIVGLAAIAVLNCATSPTLAHLLHSNLLRDAFKSIPADIPFTEKPGVQPLRVLNLALLVVAASLLDRRWKFWRSAAARPIIAIGARSLPVYSVSVVLSYLVLAGAAYCHAGPFLYVLLTIAGMMPMLMVPRISAALKSWWASRLALLEAKARPA